MSIQDGGCVLQPDQSTIGCGKKEEPKAKEYVAIPETGRLARLICQARSHYDAEKQLVESWKPSEHKICHRCLLRLANQHFVFDFVKSHLKSVALF